MYGFLYRLMPGPKWVKVLCLLLLFLAVVAVLFTWVFPAIAPYMPFNQGTVTLDGAAAQLGIPPAAPARI